MTKPNICFLFASRDIILGSENKLNPIENYFAKKKSIAFFVITDCTHR